MVQQPPATPGTYVSEPPVSGPSASGLLASDPSSTTGYEKPPPCACGLTEPPSSPLANTQPHVYVPRFSPELTAPELSTLLKFYTHPNAPRSPTRPQPSQPYIYVPGFSTELSASELSLLLTFYNHPYAPKRRASLQPCQPHVYVRGYSDEYTTSEQSALQAFSSQPHAWISRYSTSEQSALNAFSSQPHAWIPRSFASQKSTLDFAAYRFSAALACSVKVPDLQPCDPTMLPGQTQPVANFPMEAIHPISVPETTRELMTTCGTGTLALTEPDQSADCSQLGTANANPDPLNQGPAELPALNILPEDTLLPSTYDGAADSKPTNALSAPPPVPVPTLAPPPVDNDDEEEDDNNLLKAHRRVRAKHNILVGGAMKWMPEEVAYGLKEALKDLKAANRKAKKRLLSRKKPISTTAFVDFTKNFEGFMPGDWNTRPKANRAWINTYMQRVLDKACGREPAIKPTPAAPAVKEKSSTSAADGKAQNDSSASGGSDGAADTAKDGAADDDDFLPAGWAMGEDEVGGGIPKEWVVTADDLPASWTSTENGQASEPAEEQASSHPANLYPTTDAPASGLDSMMSKMSIGKGSSHVGSSLPTPAPQVAVN